MRQCFRNKTGFIWKTAPEQVRRITLFFEKLWGFCGKIVFFLKKSFDYCEKRAILCKQQRASVTQLVEYHVANVTVAGSNPVTRSNFFAFFQESIPIPDILLYCKTEFRFP